MSSLAKPQLRGLLSSQIKRNLIIGISIGIGSGMAYKFGVSEPRKKKYADFYKTYDAEKDFQRMRAAGVFDSCPAD